MNEAEVKVAGQDGRVKVNRIDHTGRRFGRWSVLWFDPDSPYRQSRWICPCDCGAERSVLAASLCNGKSISCGCISSEQTADRNRTHGKVNTRAYISWCGMIARCENPRHPSYPRYGGRGITICPEWRNSFDQFFADMGERPEELSIERIDNNAGYSAGNCKWGTDLEQARNRRSVRIIELNGLALTPTEWAKRMGYRPLLVLSRLRNGWSPERAILTAPMKNQYDSVKTLNSSVLSFGN